MSELALYFHTLRHLRPVQIGARLWQQIYRPRADLRAAPRRRAVAGAYCEPIAPAAALCAPDRIRLLNVERSCGRAADWQPADASQLWIYHLHYFDDLNAAGAALRTEWHRDMLLRWVADNPPGSGAAWEPYPLSRRIVNWIKWSLRGNQLPEACHESLAVQTRWLTARLEHHLLGNHLLANAVALVHAGCYFEEGEAQAWLARGMKILGRELKEQLLEDGGHFELSPMYHAALLTDLLDLVNLQCAYQRPVPQAWPPAIARMQSWLETLSHPDGDIAFFNDAACGMAATAAQTAAYAARLGLPPAPPVATPLAVLPHSGYVRAQAGAALLLCDCAAVGPAYLPAHAHADTLSFELSLHGQRLLVNSGVSQYGADSERLRQRGTAAHNTVVVDGADSSEVWGGFRTARRARVLRRLVEATPAGLSIEAVHDGYRRLPGRNEHRRRWLLSARSLSIEDDISGYFHSACAFFHLQPRIEVERLGPAVLQLRGPHLPAPVRMHCEGVRDLEVRGGSWHPQFGVSQQNQCAVAHLSGPHLVTRFEWQ